MLHDFLEQNRTRLIDRCRCKVLLRRAPPPTPVELEHGIPLFLAQLIDTLRTEGGFAAFAPTAASGPPAPSPRHLPSEIEQTAMKHGSEMLLRGFTVNQVVHDYGDLCQSITEFAAETGAKISAEEFNVLNRCLDDAIADAVTSYQKQRERQVSEGQRRATGERLGLLAHELRNLLGTATLASEAMRAGMIGTAGATSAVLRRSLLGMQAMIDRTLAEVRLDASMPPQIERVALDHFMVDVQIAESLSAKANECSFIIAAVEPGLEVDADTQLLHSAVSNLLHNAFKFTPRNGQVSLRSSATADRVLIEVEDECGAPPRKATPKECRAASSGMTPSARTKGWGFRSRGARSRPWAASCASAPSRYRDACSRSIFRGTKHDERNECNERTLPGLPVRPLGDRGSCRSHGGEHRQRALVLQVQAMPVLVGPFAESGRRLLLGAHRRPHGPGSHDGDLPPAPREEQERDASVRGHQGQ